MVATMKVYLDVSCLNRPFDDQNQTRIRLEAEAVALILERFDAGEWVQVSSDIALFEIDAITDVARRARVRLLLPDQASILRLSAGSFRRAEQLQEHGFKAADALHIAAAEELRANVMLSCDDRLCRGGKRLRKHLKVFIANPLEWLKGLGYGTNT